MSGYTESYEQRAAREKRAQDRAIKEVNKITNRKKRMALISIVALITFSALLLGAFYTGPAYIYQKNVHSYMEQAYYSADPVLMQENINKAKQGMENLGLTSEMYSSFWYWELTPDKQMLWEYQHLNSIDVRCNEFIAWIHAQNDTGSQQMQDVYSQKLNNIREFVRNDGGWSDDIAQSAYITNFQVFYAVGFIPVFVILFTIATWTSTCLIIYAVEDQDERLIKKLTGQYIEEEKKGEQ